MSKREKQSKPVSDDSSFSDSSSESGSSAEAPSGFTSDSYSDHGSVYVDVHWPSWKLFTDSLGLGSVQFVGPVGVVRESRLFGVLTFKPDILALSINTHGVVVNLDTKYADLVDCPSPIAIERRGESIFFHGSIGQYRKLRRALSRLLFDLLVPMSDSIPYEAQAHKLLSMGIDSEASSQISSPRHSIKKSQSRSPRPTHATPPIASTRQSKSQARAQPSDPPKASHSKPKRTSRPADK